MTTVSVYIAVLFWLGGIWRLPSALRSPSRRPLCISLLCFAAALTFDIPRVYEDLDSHAGIPNLADLVEHSFGIVGVFALLQTLEELTDVEPGRHARVRRLVPAAAVAACIALFFAASTKREATDFTERYGSNPYVAAYWAITIAYFGIVLVALGRLAHRHSARCSRAALRVGLRLVGAGVGVGVAYSVLKIVQVALAVTRPSTAGDIARVLSLTLTVGAALMGLGLLLPALESAWTAAAKHLSDRLALLRLRRLWLDVTEAVPDVILGGRRSFVADLFTPTPSYWLYRRFIEIRDVQLSGAKLELPVVGRPGVEPDTGRATASKRGNRLEVRDELGALLELARVWKPAAGRIRT